MMSRMNLGRGWILSIFLFAVLSGTVVSDDDDSSVSACRAAGFDPWQLSCATCKILPEAVVAKCRACCQSYKTSEKRTHRYEGAILLYAKNPNPDLSSEIDTLLKEDLEKIEAQKGKDRLRVVSIRGGSYYQPSPSWILWFDELPLSEDISELQSKAKETIILDGWKRDDVRDMLLALLPDK
jgi:hypothetical protein